LRREADQMLCSLLIAGVVPHLCKYRVDRERPNRALVRPFDTRVPRLGNALDSFPSGHAMHLSAIAGSARRLVPRRWWPTLIGALGALAASCCSRIIRAMLLPVGALARSSIRRSAPPLKPRSAPRQRLAAAPPLQPH